MATLIRRLATPPTNSSRQLQQQQQPRLKTTTPRSRANSSGGVVVDSSPSTPAGPLRSRFNSRDLQRTYSGQYARGPEDYLPLECIQQSQAVEHLSFYTVCYLYASLILILNILSTLIIAGVKNGSDPYFHTACWALTAGMHAIVHIAGVHWTKGAFTTGQGEMNGWTVWEQLEATPESDAHLRLLLTIVPLLLALAACYIAKFENFYCGVNVVLGAIQLVPKLSFMNGVRLFGINRTAGIDDE